MSITNVQIITVHSCIVEQRFNLCTICFQQVLNSCSKARKFQKELNCAAWKSFEQFSQDITHLQRRISQNGGGKEKFLKRFTYERVDLSQIYQSRFELLSLRSITMCGLQLPTGQAHWTQTCSLLCHSQEAWAFSLLHHAWKVSTGQGHQHMGLLPVLLQPKGLRTTGAWKPAIGEILAGQAHQRTGPRPAPPFLRVLPPHLTRVPLPFYFPPAAADKAKEAIFLKAGLDQELS